GGPTAITNLSFGTHFLMTFLDDNLAFKFQTSFGFNIGTKRSPFNITLFILGGGGYISFKADFVPEKRISDGLSVYYALSIHASVGVAVSLGFMTGGVHFFLGIEGSYIKPRGREGQTQFAIFFMLTGHVSILNLVSVHLMLLLELTYDSSKSQMIGHGRVQLVIR